MKKETKYVCLDTSFIESQNFLEGHKFRELGNLNRLGEIKLLISEIVYKEVVIRLQGDKESIKFGDLFQNSDY
jgi:hypothetical protein